MTNEVAKAQLAELVELVEGSFASVARAQQERARLTATAHVEAGDASRSPSMPTVS